MSRPLRARRCPSEPALRRDSGADETRAPGATAHGPERNAYSAGYLVDVGTPAQAGFFATIAYHPNGLWSSLAHGNMTTTTQVNDPDSMRRPRQIFVSGLLEEAEGEEAFDSGVYQYDGSGNIWAM